MKRGPQSIIVGLKSASDGRTHGWTDTLLSSRLVPAENKTICRQLVRTVAPVLPHLADEVNLHLNRDDDDAPVSVMRKTWNAALESVGRDVEAARMQRIFTDSLFLRKYLFIQTKLSNDDLKEIDIVVEIGSPHSRISTMTTDMTTTTTETMSIGEIRDVLGELLRCATLTVDLVSENDKSSPITGWNLPPLPSIKRVVQTPASEEEEDREDVPSKVAVEEEEEEEKEMEVLTPYFSDGSEFRFVTRKTEKTRCLRCRLFRCVESDETLCSRCRNIVAP